MPENERGRDWDAYAAVIASLVGLLALGVSLYTAYLQQQTLRAQVWPRLSLSSSNMNLRLYATNDGMGPARVKGVRVKVGGKVARLWSDVASAMGGNGKELAFSTLNGRVVPPGETLEIAMPRDEASKDFFRQLVGNDNPHGFYIMACYCSVLGDCWTTGWGMSDGSPDKKKEPENEDDEQDDDEEDAPLSRCEIPRSEQFRN